MEESKLKKNIPTLIILAVSGALIYALPYFRHYYYDVFLEAFKLTNTQMGTLGSAYGISCLISYIFGGYCADRWKTKNLLTLSLVTTGLLGFVLLWYPPYWVLLGIHSIWGITSIMTFWGALIKAIRTLGTDNEQGKVFGFFEGGRGITNVVQAAIILFIFSALSKRGGEQMALSGVVVIYSIVCLILAVCIMLLYKEPESVSKEKSGEKGPRKKFDWVLLGKILKKPTTWLATILILTSYAMIISYYYITPYTTAAFGASTIIGAALGYFSQYCRPVGAFGGGIIGDKIGVSNMVFLGYAALAIGLVGLIFLPAKSSFIIMLIVLIAIIYTSMYALQALHFAILSEGDFPVETTGTVSMPLMIVGYSGEIFMPLIAGVCIDRFSGTTGYKIFFAILLGFTVLGLITVIIWRNLTKEKRAELAVLRKEKAKVS